MIAKEDMRCAVANIMKKNMGLKDGETILIVNDVPVAQEWNEPINKIIDIGKRSIFAKQFYEITIEEFKNHKVSYLTYYTLGQHGEEPPEDVGKAMICNDVIIGINSYSLSHTIARQIACNRGARIASLPNILPEMFLRNGPLDVDYENMKAITLKVSQVLSKGNNVKIIAQNGTELYFNIASRVGKADTGLIHEKGDWGNLPGGEACIAPVEGTTFGKLVVSADWYSGLEQDMIFFFKEGEVVEIINGGRLGDYFRKLLNPSSQDLKFRRRRNCAELGIGTNPNARRRDNVLEAEKIKGTIHIAIGDNSYLGGLISSDIHEDFIVDKPDVYIDDTCIIKSGKLIWEV